MSEFDKSKVRGSTPKSSPKTNEELFTEAKSKIKQSEEDKKSAEDDLHKKEKYRKCSSLRSGKTPPGTPARRKIVRYLIELFSPFYECRLNTRQKSLVFKYSNHLKTVWYLNGLNMSGCQMVQFSNGGLKTGIQKMSAA